MERAARARLLDAIGEVVDRIGGSFAMRYECVLVTGVRPG
jgi:hypothetical protein